MTATDEELHGIDRYWAAANYLTVGQIFLQDNPLLREPLRPEHIKPRLLGHWGTSPGLSLIYTQCSDGTGCPLATHRMKELKERIDQQPALPSQLRFVSLSFDPDHDTPAVMRRYGRGFVSGRGGVPWHFLTTRSRKDVEPLVRGLGQDVWMPREGGGPLSHVLKVFLIDRRGFVREIYSTSFLHTQVLLNDIRTLLLEDHADG